MNFSPLNFSPLHPMMYGSPQRSLLPEVSSPTKFDAKAYEVKLLRALANKLNQIGQPDKEQQLFGDDFMSALKSALSIHSEQENCKTREFRINWKVNGQPRQLWFKQENEHVEIGLANCRHTEIINKNFNQLTQEFCNAEASGLEDDSDSDDTYDKVVKKLEQVKVSLEHLPPPQGSRLDNFLKIANVSSYAKWRDNLAGKPGMDIQSPTTERRFKANSSNS